MELELWKKPKGVTIIEGFPGFGLVGTIATEFLLDHLDCELIGKIFLKETAAVVAIHEDKVVEPLGIFYCKKYNLVIIHAVTASTGLEWGLADHIKQIAKDLNAKEIISLEGVGSSMIDAPSDRLFYYTNSSTIRSKLNKQGMEPLKEGIIMGVTGALLLRARKLPLACIFAETKTDLPDSSAAARIITALDDYLGLKVDPKPLLEQAEKFEEKLQSILKQGTEAQKQVDKKRMSYVG